MAIITEKVCFTDDLYDYHLKECPNCRGEGSVLKQSSRFDMREENFFPKYDEVACPICEGEGLVFCLSEHDVEPAILKGVA